MKQLLSDLPVFVNVTVCYHDIMIGLRNSQTNCPGALAIKRKLALEDIKFSKVYVDEERISIYDLDGDLLVTQCSPPEIVQLISDHDSDIPASPCVFKLFIREANLLDEIKNTPGWRYDPEKPELGWVRV